jgi:hypothetical protein
MKIKISTIVLLFFSIECFSQIGINTTTPEAMLEVSSSNNGFLLPRVSLTGNNDITTVVNPNGGSLANSTMVYNLTAITGLNAISQGYCYWNGTKWLSFVGNNSHNWGLFGNSNTITPTLPAIYGTSTIGVNENFIGTTDNKDLVFGANSIERMKIKNTNGFVGIGTSDPLYKLHIVKSNIGSVTTYSENTYSGNSSGIGVFGKSVNNPGYGIGGTFEGGYNGVNGLAIGGNSPYAVGVRGVATGDGSFPSVRVGGSFNAAGSTLNSFGVQGYSSGASYGNFGGKFTSNGGQVATGGDFFADDGTSLTTGGYFEAKGIATNYGGRFATYGPSYTTGANINYAGHFLAYGALNNYAGYFDSYSGTNNYALVTDRGRVGIGTTVPNRAHLQVQGSVGNTVATFNSSANSNGLAIVSDWPGLYFNSYFDGGTRQMSNNSYPAIINYNPGGQFEFTMSNTLNTSAGNLCLGTTGGFANRFILHRDNGAILNYNNLNITGLEVISGGFSTNIASFSTNGDNADVNSGKGIEAAGNFVGVEGRANGPQATSTGDKMGGLFYVSSNATINNFSAVGAVIDFTNYKIIGGGIVSTLVKDEQDKVRIMVAPESPEALFQDYGIGTLINGYAKIDVDPILTKNIRVDKSHPLKVFIQLEGDCNGVFVYNKSASGFEVKELQNGSSNVSFSYQIVASRADEESEGYISKFSDMRFKPMTLNLKIEDRKFE